MLTVDASIGLLRGHCHASDSAWEVDHFKADLSPSPDGFRTVCCVLIPQ